MGGMEEMDMIVKNFEKKELLITSFNTDLTKIKGKILEIDKRERALIFNSNVKINIKENINKTFNDFINENIDKIFNGYIFKVDVDVLYDYNGKIKFYLIQRIY